MSGDPYMITCRKKGFLAGAKYKETPIVWFKDREAAERLRAFYEALPEYCFPKINIESPFSGFVYIARKYKREKNLQTPKSQQKDLFL